MSEAESVLAAALDTADGHVWSDTHNAKIARHILAALAAAGWRLVPADDDECPLCHGPLASHVMAERHD